ncbi:MAG: cation diffusion facilitator family transporter [Actinomycetota bacterium]
MGHDHTHERLADRRSGHRRLLWIVLGLNLVFLVAEVVGGIAFDSLALLADAAHMATDVTGLAIAMVAQGLLTRPATTRHTFGLQRAEVLGAGVNGMLLLASTVWIVIEALRRLDDPPDVAGVGVLVVALAGLAVNIGSAAVLARSRRDNLNMRGAFIHMVADAAASVGVVVAALAVILADATWVDPAVSLLIAVLVAWSAWGLLKDTVHVLMEGVPRGLEAEEVEATVAAIPGVEEVHHLHLWNLASDVAALSAHVVVAENPTVHDAQAVTDTIRRELADGHGIAHATIELECHPCDDPDHA